MSARLQLPSVIFFPGTSENRVWMELTRPLSRTGMGARLWCRAGMAEAAVWSGARLVEAAVWSGARLDTGDIMAEMSGPGLLAVQLMMRVAAR